jgi:N-acetylmuramoyl-L-alanine amidase
MRKIDMIVVHCSGSRCNHRYTLEQLRHDHVVVNGWRDIGYHFYITLEGVVYPCRPVERMGAHALGYNAHSIGICYEGGLSPSGCISDTRTPAQKEAMKLLILRLHREFPDISHVLRVQIRHVLHNLFAIKQAVEEANEQILVHCCSKNSLEAEVGQQADVSFFYLLHNHLF